MLLPTSRVMNFPDFPLSGGARLAELAVAYETWGTLNEAGTNAILLCHGYTSSPHAAGDEDGWCRNLVGPGLAIDTDRYFVVCANMIGSSYGTSGPATTDPATGRPYGPDFPKYLIADMVEAQHRLIDALGIAQLAAVVGYSYGGHLTFIWGVTHPERMRALVPIAGTMDRRKTPEQIQALRDRFAARCPGWNGGHYHDRLKESGVFDELVAHRMESQMTYGFNDWLNETVGNPAEREAILRERAESWAARFDANSLWILYEAGLGSTAVPLAGQMRAPLLNVLASTDKVVDVAVGQPTVDLLRSKGVNARFHRIETVYGHYGPMIDAAKWAGELGAFLEEHT